MGDDRENITKGNYNATGDSKRFKNAQRDSLSHPSRKTWLLLLFAVLKTREAERQTPANPWVP
jgi:hypothetical protein